MVYFKKTKLKKDDEIWWRKPPYAAFVGIKWDEQKTYATKLAGYRYETFDIVTDFTEFLDKKIIPNKEILSYEREELENVPRHIDILCVADGYGYGNPRSEVHIPFKETKYCTLEGLTYYQERKTKINAEYSRGAPLFQGLQLIRELKNKDVPIKKFVVYKGLKTPAKQLGVDHISKGFRNRRDEPVELYEYLRMHNTDRFE